MRRLWVRAAMIVVGFVVLAVYTAGAVGGLLLLQWLFANPPSPLTLGSTFLVAIVVAGYLGYRLGTIRLVASLDATVIPRERAPNMYRRLERLCLDANVEEPKLLIADLEAPNALSVGGPRRGVIVVDRRLFELLTVDELEGILAHEIAHMESYDTFVNTLALTAARTLVGLVALLVFPVVLLLVGVDRAAAWFAGRPGQWRFGLSFFFQQGVRLVLGVVLGIVTIVFLAYSRRQEFAADRRAAELTGDPVALARALAKLHRATTPREGLLSLLYTHDDRTTDEYWWLSTHPPVEERIDRLAAMADHATASHYLGRIRPR